MKLARHGTGWALLVWVGVSLGCAGALKDPWRFETDGGADGGVDAGTGACPPGYDVPVDLFQATCGTVACHTGATPAGGLDLVSANVASRLIARPSSTCAGRVLISSVDSGFLFDKLEGNPACGFPMPLGKTPLTGQEMACLVEWVSQQMDGGT